MMRKGFLQRQDNLLILGFVLLTGLLYAASRKTFPPEGYLLERGQKIIQIESVRSLNGWVSGTARLLAIKSQGEFLQCNQTVLVYPDNKQGEIRINDILICLDPVEHIRRRGNPGELDYRWLCYTKRITGEIRLKQKWFKIGVSDNLIGNIKGNALHRLKSFLPERNQFMIASALILGDTDAIDSETWSNYSISGVIHILSVSGLHVGLIFIMAGFLLKVVGIKKGWAFTGTVFLFIWAYTFFSGFSAPVLRAVIMFSIFLCGKQFFRDTSSLNILAGTAIILLMYEPLYLFQVGFQFSVLSVAGILVVYPLLQTRYNPSNKILLRLWQLSSVSVAAQVFTTPLMFYYFHSVPVYFIISNLVIVPLSALILYIGIFVLVPVQWIADVFAFLLKQLLWFQDKTIHWICQLPFNQVSGFFPDKLEVMLWYLVILILIAYLTRKDTQKRFLIVVLASALFFYHEVRRLVIAGQQQVVVYHLDGKLATGFIQGRNIIFITDLSRDNKQLKILRKHVMEKQLNVVEWLGGSELYNGAGVYKKGIYIMFYGKRFICLDFSKRNFRSKEHHSKFKTDFLLVKGLTQYRFNWIKRNFLYKKMILVDKEPRLSDPSIYPVSREGAWILNVD